MPPSASAHRACLTTDPTGLTLRQARVRAPKQIRQAKTTGAQSGNDS